MKPTFRLPFALILLSLLVACGQSNLDKLNGAWKCDGKATVALNPDMAKTGAMGERLLGGMALYFDIPAKTITMGPGKMTPGDFSVVSDSGKTVVLDGLGSRLTIEFQNSDTIHVNGAKDPQKTLVFTRVQ